jgi:CHAT domain-containing protein
LRRVAFLSYLVWEDVTAVFALRPDQPEPLVVQTAIGRDDLQTCVDRLLLDCNGVAPGVCSSETKQREDRALQLPPPIHRAERQWPQHAGPDPRRLEEPNYALTYLDELSDRLLPRSIQRFVEDREVLCISPHGPLHDLPLHALRWSDGQYVGERFGVSYVPNAGVLRHCQARNRARGQRADTARPTALAVGIDMLGDQHFEVDGQMVARFTNCRTLAGRVRATKARVLEELGRAQVIHLACHGLYAADCGWGHPLQSGILLGSEARDSIDLRALLQHPESFQDCLLTAREIATLSLNADLVSLRACSTGRAQIMAGDDRLGLGRAWLYAGTPSVFLTLWNVSTASSANLFRSFYAGWLGAGMQKWQALRTAQRTLIRGHDHPAHRHPYHWAPFVLVGDWA